jgi:hypothetical protein
VEQLEQQQQLLQLEQQQLLRLAVSGAAAR